MSAQLSIYVAVRLDRADFKLLERIARGEGTRVEHVLLDVLRTAAARVEAGSAGVEATGKTTRSKVTAAGSGLGGANQEADRESR